MPRGPSPTFDARRRFMQRMMAAVSALGLATVLPPVLRRAMPHGWLDVAGEVFRNAEHAVNVGRACLARFPDMALTAPANMATLASSGSAFADRFQRQRRQDFAAGDVVVLQGWMFARCEADLCVALALPRA